MNLATPVALAACLLGSALPAHAQTGRIGFAGRIVEPTCAMRTDRPDCPAERPAAITVRTLHARTALAAVRSALLDYAMRREPTQRWELIEVSYR